LWEWVTWLFGFASHELTGNSLVPDLLSLEGAMKQVVRVTEIFGDIFLAIWDKVGTPIATIMEAGAGIVSAIGGRVSRFIGGGADTGLPSANAIAEVVSAKVETEVFGDTMKEEVSKMGETVGQILEVLQAGGGVPTPGVAAQPGTSRQVSAETRRVRQGGGFSPEARR